MDRRLFLVKRARELFGERWEEVVDEARKDGLEMRGWEEPAHVSAVLRQSVQGLDKEGDKPRVQHDEESRASETPEPAGPLNRENLPRLFEAGAVGLERACRDEILELTDEETRGLECLMIFYGRPGISISHGRLEAVPAFWKCLDNQRQAVDRAQRAVGRIELLGHPEFDWAGTGFLVGEQCLLTTRRTVEVFAERRHDSWAFRPGITAWMNFRSDDRPATEAGYRVRSIIGVHARYDLALLEIEHPQAGTETYEPLLIVSQPPPNLETRPVYLVGYPMQDARRREPDSITRVFRDFYNVKRVLPGTLRGNSRFEDVELLRHDCGLLGRMEGSALVDLETHHVLGLHLTSRYLEPGTAVPLWTLHEDPLFRDTGVAFVEANPGELDLATRQIERLARSRCWTEVRAALSVFYERVTEKGE